MYTNTYKAFIVHVVVAMVTWSCHRMDVIHVDIDPQGNNPHTQPSFSGVHSGARDNQRVFEKESLEKKLALVDDVEKIICLMTLSEDIPSIKSSVGLGMGIAAVSSLLLQGATWYYNLSPLNAAHNNMTRHLNLSSYSANLVNSSGDDQNDAMILNIFNVFHIALNETLHYNNSVVCNANLHKLSFIQFNGWLVCSCLGIGITVYNYWSKLSRSLLATDVQWSKTDVQWIVQEVKTAFRQAMKNPFDTAKVNHAELEFKKLLRIVSILTGSIATHPNFKERQGEICKLLQKIETEIETDQLNTFKIYVEKVLTS